MSKATDIRIVQARSSTQLFQYRTPIKFGGRVVNNAVILNVEVEVETQSGKRGQGFGSMPMGNTWGWPSDSTLGDDTLKVMVDLGQRLVAGASDHSDHGHPLEITHELSQTHGSIAKSSLDANGVTEAMPRLAQLISASPLEAAIHDAYGKALGQNSYNVLGAEYVNTDISTYLTPEFAGEYLDQYTSRRPKPRMPLYHLVGALDPLTDDDIDNRIDDGLPETLGEWIAADGLTHMKIKLNGDNLDWDVNRVVSIERVAAEAEARRGCKEWFYSLDFNEKCANVQYLLEFLAKVNERSPEAFARAQYIEQPTNRNLDTQPENPMHEAAKIKPVVIDESLVDFESLQLARELGYSGVALKACKGHTEALLMGAAAQKYKMFLCVQDLTCPGYSFLHSASLSARVPTIAAIEGNGRQYCPAANEAWKDRYPGLFHISDGTVETATLTETGLGFSAG